LVSELLVLLLPCIVSTLVFFPTYPSFILIRLTLCSLAFFYFIITIRQTFKSSSELPIQKIVHELDSAMVPWIAVVVIGWILLLIFITQTTLQRNQYVVNSLVLICFQSLNSAILYFTKLTKYQEPQPITEKKRSNSNKRIIAISKSP